MSGLRIADRMSRLGTESAFETLAQAKRLEAQGRDVVHMEIGEPDFATPPNISEAAIRAERTLRLEQALNQMDPLDREVLALRHFEQLTRAETAVVLGIAEEAGAKRYIRALKKLKTILAAMPGGLEGP